MKLRIHCSECAWWEIRGNYGPLCWRPGDGPELRAANEQACEWLEEREEGDAPPATIWMQYHDRERDDLAAALNRLRKPPEFFASQGEQS